MNGVPLRRVPQSYVIATQTKVDVDSASIPKDLDDSFFKRQKKEKKRGDEMFEQTQEVSVTRVFITQSSHDPTRENSQKDGYHFRKANCKTEVFASNYQNGQALVYLRQDNDFYVFCATDLNISKDLDLYFRQIYLYSKFSHSFICFILVIYSTLVTSNVPANNKA